MSLPVRLEALLPETNLDPRPYQSRLVKKTQKLFTGRYVNGSGRVEPAHRSVMIESPVGSGKTPVGLLIGKLLQNDTGCDVIWMCMRRTPLKQARDENAPRSVLNQRGKNIGLDAHFLSMFTNDMPSEVMPENRNGRKLLLVHDEGVHDASDTAAHQHNLLKPDWILGLSAYPYRTDSVKLCFEKTIRDVGIHELISQGYLSPYDHYSIHDWKPENVAEHYARDPERWGASMVFFLTIELCQRFKNRMLELGIPADVVTGNTKREEQIEALRTGEVAALANCAALSEGFDFPDLKTVWVRDSGQGCTTQMCGRVFRKSSLYDRKQVVQSKNTKFPFIRSAMPVVQNIWQNSQWRSLTVNPMLDQVAQNTTFMLAHTPQEIPQFLLEKQKKKRVHRGTGWQNY